MNEQLLCVAPQLVDHMWPHVVAFIERAAIRSNSDYTPQDILAKLHALESLLWVVTVNKKIAAAMTTEICSVLGHGRILVITSYGGKMTEQWDRLFEQLEQYARDEKCTKIRLYGRTGWARFFRNKGFQQPWIALEKQVQ